MSGASSEPPPSGARVDRPLPIAETFVSIQGEGRLAGTPSWFARVAGCNLRCAWCDTPYASWNPEGSLRSIDSLLAEAAESRARHAVITGGEPMIFDGAIELSRRLAASGVHVTIETAGTATGATDAALISISPKLSNSTPRNDPRDPGRSWELLHESRRWNPAAVQSLIDTHPAFQLKYVVGSRDDLPEIESMLGMLRGWNPDDVFLMPEGVGPVPEPLKSWTIRTCLDRGWRYGHRLHIELFGNRRGT